MLVVNTIINTVCCVTSRSENSRCEPIVGQPLQPQSGLGKDLKSANFYLSSPRVGVIIMSVVVFGTIIGLLIFWKFLGIRTLLGSALIIASGIWLNLAICNPILGIQAWYRWLQYVDRLRVSNKN